MDQPKKAEFTAKSLSQAIKKLNYKAIQEFMQYTWKSNEDLLHKILSADYKYNPLIAASSKKVLWATDYVRGVISELYRFFGCYSYLITRNITQLAWISNIRYKHTYFTPKDWIRIGVDPWYTSEEIVKKSGFKNVLAAYDKYHTYFEEICEELFEEYRNSSENTNKLIDEMIEIYMKRKIDESFKSKAFTSHDPILLEVLIKQKIEITSTDIFSFFRALPPTKPDVAINLIPSFEEKVFAATSLLVKHINFKEHGMTYLLSLSQWHDYYWRSIEVVLKRATDCYKMVDAKGDNILHYFADDAYQISGLQILFEILPRGTFVELFFSNNKGGVRPRDLPAGKYIWEKQRHLFELQETTKKVLKEKEIITANTSKLFNIPNELLQHIISFIPLKMAARSLSVSRKWMRSVAFASCWTNQLLDMNMPLRVIQDQVPLHVICSLPPPRNPVNQYIRNSPKMQHIFNRHNGNVFEVISNNDSTRLIQDGKICASKEKSDVVTFSMNEESRRKVFDCNSLLNYGVFIYDDPLRALDPILRHLPRGMYTIVIKEIQFPLSHNWELIPSREIKENELDKYKIEYYKEVISAGNIHPFIIVIASYVSFLVDGYHKLEACKELVNQFGRIRIPIIKIRTLQGYSLKYQRYYEN